MVLNKKPVFIVLGGPGAAGGGRSAEHQLVQEVAAKTLAVPVTLAELFLAQLTQEQQELMDKDENGNLLIPTGNVQFPADQLPDRLKQVLNSDSVLFRGTYQLIQ